MALGGYEFVAVWTTPGNSQYVESHGSASKSPSIPEKSI